jgi:MFS family permease
LHNETAPTLVARPVRATILLASMMTVMAGAIVAPALPDIQKHFVDHPNAALLTRLIVTTPALAIAIIAPLSGFVVDAFGRKRLLIASLILYAIAGTSGVWLQSLEMILVGRLILGVSIAGVMTSATTLIGDLFPGPSRSQFLGLQAAFMSISGVLFFPIGGALTELSWHGPFLIYVLSIPVAILAWRVLSEPPRTVASLTAAAEKFPLLSAASICLAAHVLSMAMYVAVVQWSFLARDVLKASSFQFSTVGALMMLASAVVGLNFSRFASPARLWLIYAVSFGLMGLGYALLSIATTLWWAIPGLIISGIGSGLFMPNSSLGLMNKVPTVMRGRAVGLLTACIFAGHFLSPLVTQPIVKQAGTAGAFWWWGVGLCAAGVLMAVAWGVMPRRNSSVS